MGYLFLSIALLCGVVKGYCGKKSGDGLIYTSDVMAVNTVRMLFCIVINFAVIGFGTSCSALAADSGLILTALLSGMGTAIFTVSWLLSVRKGAYMMVDIFLLIGVIIPIILSKVFFGEQITILQWCGMLLLLIAGCIMCNYNASLKGKMSLKAFVLLALCALSNGITDFSQKLFVKMCVGGNVAVFSFYSYVFAAIILGIFYIAFRTREKRHHTLESPIKIVKPIIGYVMVMAVCLFLNSYFKTLATGYLTAAEIYPLSQGGSVILSMIMSAIFFRERINTKSAVGVALSFVALILTNVI